MVAAHGGQAPCGGRGGLPPAQQPVVRRLDVVDQLAGVEWKNAKKDKIVFTIHNISQFSFDEANANTGLGEFRTTRRGFFGHVALLAAADGVVRPNDVAGFDAYTIRDHQWHRDVGDGQEQHRGFGSERWTSLALAVGHNKPEDVDLVHVMDR